MKSSASKIKMTSFDDLFDTSETRINTSSNTFVVNDINIELIKVNENNFYYVKDLEKLKMSIKAVGLKHNLVVSTLKDENTYQLISGHRRFKAIQELINEGELDWTTVPCTIEKKTDLEQRLTLILANSTARELTSFEKMKQVEEMKLIAQEIKEVDSTQIKGKTRDFIAEFLEMSTSEVARYEAISNNLDENIKEELKEENISTDTAYAISRLQPEQQEEALELIKEAKEENKKVTTKDIKTITQKENKIVTSTNEDEDWVFENQIGIGESVEIFNESNSIIETEDNSLQNKQDLGDGKVNLDELDLEPELTKESIEALLINVKANLCHSLNFLKIQDKEFTTTVKNQIQCIKERKLEIIALEKLLENICNEVEV
ncbi:MAG: ParB/RepB/Spo0J family partition protein [Lachnospirales bacterium]